MNTHKENMTNKMTKKKKKNLNWVSVVTTLHEEACVYRWGLVGMGKPTEHKHVIFLLQQDGKMS